MQKEKYPEGHFISMYMAIFMPLGLIYGLILGPSFYGMGLGIGLVMGIAVGTAIEVKYKKEGKIRPLTKNEKRKRRVALFVGLALGILVVLLFFIFLLI